MQKYFCGESTAHKEPTCVTCRIGKYEICAIWDT